MLDLINQHVVLDANRQRLSDYLIGVFEELPSRKSVKKAIDKGRVKVNGQVANTGYYPQQNDEVQLFEEALKHPEYQFKVEVVYEDDYYALINKPAGLKVSGNDVLHCSESHQSPMVLKDSECCHEYCWPIL